MMRRNTSEEMRRMAQALLLKRRRDRTYQKGGASGSSGWSANPAYDHLVSYWNMEDGFDYAGGGNYATQSPSITKTTGKLGNCFQFSGTDYLRASDAANLSFGNGTTDSAFSVSMWVYCTTIAGAQRYFFTKRDGISTLAEYQVFHESNGKVSFALLSGGSNTAFLYATSVGALTTNTWYHIVCTYSGSRTFGGIKIYINGVSQSLTNSSTGSYVAMSNTTAGLSIGSSFSLGSNGVIGKLDEVGLYSEELSQTKIDAIYNSGNGLAYSYNPAVYAHHVYESPYQILAVQGNYMFATDAPTGGTNLKFSSNGGTSWTDYVWGTMYSAGSVYNKTVEFAYIFADGTVLFAITNKIYRSTDGLATVNEITTIYEADGVTPYTRHTPANAIYPGNYFQTINYDPYFNTVDGNEIIVWTNYCNVVTQNEGVAPTNVYYTKDKGATIKVLFKFGQNPNYRDNGTAGGSTSTGTLLGDSGQSTITRHGHGVCRNPGTNDWYSCYGDASGEVHWYKHTYNSGSDTWTNTRILTSIVGTLWQACPLFIHNNVIYWGNDYASAGSSERGIWKCNISDIGVTATRVLDLGYTSVVELKINPATGKMLAILGLGDGPTNVIYTIDNYGEGTVRQFIPPQISTGIFFTKVAPLNNGYWKIAAGDFWTQPKKTFFVKG